MISGRHGIRRPPGLQKYSLPYSLRSPVLKPLVDIPAMAQASCGMVQGSLEALARTYRMADPGTILRALVLLLISRSLERVGDHAANIAEEVICWVQGKDVRTIMKGECGRKGRNRSHERSGDGFPVLGAGD